MFGLTSKDIEAIPDASIPSSADDAAASSVVRYEQEITSAAGDGVQLAYARMGASAGQNRPIFVKDQSSRRPALGIRATCRQ